ncbi:MAG: NUDIX domain-containing protein [Mycoplasmataceae bacterium]|nr:NUDIX domain-containing protein [Mycoplasmataceae bacterium]
MNKCLYKHNWLSVHETKRGFIYAQRRTINSTATLLYAKKGKQTMFLLRYQPLPALIENSRKARFSKLYPCCVTGSIEKNESPLQNAIKEVFEETNYVIKKSDIKMMNRNVASTQMNEMVYVFIADITKARFVKKRTGDGTIFESLSKNKWISEKQMINILKENKTIYLSSLACAYYLYKMFNKNNI